MEITLLYQYQTCASKRGDAVGSGEATPVPIPFGTLLILYFFLSFFLLFRLM